ncbi:MAG: hypothetical protein N2578_00830 [Bdellovibrionaceae bacterium]|nr:hypothetical protein [Pseudobdellovibrionaceae bacterium]
MPEGEKNPQEKSETPQDDTVNQPPPEQENRREVQIGLILGPGGVLAWQHISFLHEAIKAKVPIRAVAGVENGALVAALFAQTRSANTAGWQITKLKSRDLSDSRELSEKLPGLFEKKKVEEFDIPFLCPSWNVQKGRVFLMDRGPVAEMIRYCLSYPPGLEPYKGALADFYSIESVADALKKRGATHVVFVNVLPVQQENFVEPFGSAADILWREAARRLKALNKGIDFQINFTGKWGLRNYEKGREIINLSGFEASKLVSDLVQKLNL